MKTFYQTVSLPLTPTVSLALAALVAAALALVGCSKSAPRLDLHYLPGFVPGTQNLFAKQTFAIAPLQGELAQGPARVGAIYDEQGRVKRELVVEAPGEAVGRALVRCLVDTGLYPFMLHRGSPSESTHLPPSYSNYLLACDLKQLSVDKRFLPQQTVHGQVFHMQARVALACRLYDRHGAVLYQGELQGEENEPPAPVGHETFLPLETDPAESLSVALSRAVGQLPLAPAFRKALPGVQHDGAGGGKG